MKYFNLQINYKNTLLILGLNIFLGSVAFGQCCTANPIQNNGFENAISVSERFPDNSTVPTNNAVTTSLPNWGYADGNYSLSPTIIDDGSRASVGDQFCYVPNPSGTPTYNKCLGTTLSYTASYTCQAGQYTTGLRYIASFDYAAFNPSVPSGGSGYTQPKFEYQFSSLVEIDLYDAAGNVLNMNETAVAWNDIASS